MNKTRIRHSLVPPDGFPDDEIVLFDSIGKKGKDDLIVKDPEDRYRHYHYYVKNGKIYCHIKDEKTGKRIPCNKSLREIRADIIKRKSKRKFNNQSL